MTKSIADQVSEYGERVALRTVYEKGSSGFYSDGHYREATIADLDTYGHWDHDKNGRYLVPQYCSGSDYSGQLVEVSNAQAFSETFSDGNGKWWTEVSGGYGTFAIVIDLEGIPDSDEEDSPDDLRDQVVEWLHALSLYPLADEDLHSHLEVEAQDEAWKDWAQKDFARAIAKRLSLEDEDTLDADLLSTVFYETSDKIGEYWINEQGDSMWIRVDKIAAKVSQESLDQLLASTIPHLEAVKRLKTAEHRIGSLKNAVKKVHAQLSDPSVGQAASELTALLDALEISPMEWERCKARGTLPDGRPIFV